MKTFYLLIVSLFITCFQSNAQTWQWTHPESNNDLYADNFAHDVEVDSSGNVYVLSFYRDSLFLGGSFRAKGTGSCIAKYNPAGALQWYKLIENPDGKGLIYASDMVVNAKGVFVTGCYGTPGLYLCNYDCTTGQTTCAKPAYTIGGVNFTSQFGDLGFFLTRFNTNGTVSWNKLGKSTASNCDLPFVAGLGGALRPLITSDKNNNITVAFIAGTSYNTPNSISIGGDIIPLEANPNVSQLVTVKYNATGVFQLSAHTNGGSHSGIVDYNSIAADNNGNIFLYGTAFDSTYFGTRLFRTSTPPDGDYVQSTFIAKLSSNGEWLFAKELCNGSQNFINGAVAGSTNYANPDLLTIDDNNNVYALVNASNTTAPQIILGDTTGHTKYGSNFLVKITNNGDLVWDKFFAGEVYTYSYSISYSNNNLYLNGEMHDYGYPGLIFSDLYIPYKGGNGIEQSFIAKADLDGNFKWVTTFNADYRTWGVGIKAYEDNIYTCGTYSYQLTTLGNLNGAPSNTGNYKIFSGKLKDQYIRVGAVTPTALIPGCTVNIPFTSYGLIFSAKNKFFAELSNANGDFSSVITIGNTTSTGTGTITAKIPATLTYSSGYRIRIRSSDTLATGYNYYAYADTGYALTLTCPAPSSGFTATNITGTSATLNWAAVGCAAGYKVQYRVKGTTTWTTAPLITTNTATLSLTGLVANTTYQWRVATRCKNNGTSGFSPYSTVKKFTTATAAVFASVDASEAAITQAGVITLQPNPATTHTLLTINGKLKDASITLIDFSGKPVWRSGAVNSNNVLIPVSNLASGVYLVKVNNGAATKILKLVKQ